MEKIEEFMKAEGYDLGRATSNRPQIAFKDMLGRFGIEKVAISGFGNGRGHLVKIPASLLGNVDEAQLLFVKCNPKGYAYMTEKLVLARAAGLPVVSSSFLATWAESGEMPELEEHPVMCEQWWAAGHPLKPLPPINPNLFAGQKFCVDLDGWIITGVTLEQIIQKLGGEIVDNIEADSSSKCVMISSRPIRGKEAFQPIWIASMVVAGRELLGAKWRIEDEADDIPFSQVWLELGLSSSTVLLVLYLNIFLIIRRFLQPLAGKSPLLLRSPH